MGPTNPNEPLFLAPVAQPLLLDMGFSVFSWFLDEIFLLSACQPLSNFGVESRWETSPRTPLKCD